jgi:DNA invertase Pin-like site-specific DNA recombinase
MSKTYIYGRFSSEKQRDGTSEKRQRDMAEAYANENGWTIDTTLMDRAISGWKNRGHKLGVFLAGIEQGKIKKGDRLICENADRFSRDDPWTIVPIFMSIINAGIDVHFLNPRKVFVKGKCDGRDLADFVGENTRSYAENKRKSDMIRATMYIKRGNLSKQILTAMCPSWLVPKQDRTGFLQIPSKVKIVQRIFRLAINGTGICGIAKQLNQEHVPNISRKNKTRQWHPSYVSKILHNRAVVGEYTPRFLNDDRQRVKGKSIQNYYPAIIKVCDYDTTHRLMHSRLTQRGPKGKCQTNLFTGLLYTNNSTLTIQDKGDGHRLVSSQATRGIGDYVSFPYFVWERAFLFLFSDLKIKDETEAVDYDAQRKNVIYKIERLKQRMEDEDFESFLDVLAQLEQQKKTIDAQEQAHKLDVEKTHQEAVSLIEQLEKSDDLLNLRTQLKTHISQIVKRIDIEITKVSRTERELNAKITMASTEDVKQWTMEITKRDLNRMTYDVGQGYYTFAEGIIALKLL